MAVKHFNEDDVAAVIDSYADALKITRATASNRLSQDARLLDHLHAGRSITMARVRLIMDRAKMGWPDGVVMPPVLQDWDG